MQESNQAIPAKRKASADFKFQARGRSVKNDVVYYDDTIRWPIWRSALLVFGICGAFWGAVIYGCLRLFG